MAAGNTPWRKGILVRGLRKAGDARGGREAGPRLGFQTQVAHALGKLLAFGCCSALGLVSKTLFSFLEKRPLSGVCDGHGCAQDRGLGTGVRRAWVQSQRQLALRKRENDWLFLLSPPHQRAPHERLGVRVSEMNC